MLTLNVKQIIGLRRCRRKWYIEMGNASTHTPQFQRKRPKHEENQPNNLVRENVGGDTFF